MHLDTLLVLCDASDPVLTALDPGLVQVVGPVQGAADYGLILLTAEGEGPALRHPALGELRGAGAWVVGLLNSAPDPELPPPAVDLMLITPEEDRAAQILLLADMLRRDPALIRHLRELEWSPEQPPVRCLGRRFSTTKALIRAAEDARSVLPADGSLRHALALVHTGEVVADAALSRLSEVFGGVLHLNVRLAPELGRAVDVLLFAAPMHEDQPATPRAHPAVRGLADALLGRLSGGGAGPPRVAAIHAPALVAPPSLSWEQEPMDEAMPELSGAEPPDAGAEPPFDIPAPAPRSTPQPSPEPEAGPDPMPSSPMITTLAEAFVQSGLPAKLGAELVVRAGFRPPARGEVGLSVRAETPEGAAIEVRLEASPADAAQIQPDRARVQLRPDGFSEMARFVVLPRVEGRLSLRASFDRGAENIAAIPLELSVGTELQPALGPAANGDAVAAKVGPSPEERYLLRLVVLSEQDDREILRFEWTAPDFSGPRGAPHPLDASLREHCRNLYTSDRVKSWYEWYNKKDQATGERRVGQDGAQLAQALLPPEVAAVLKALIEGGEPHLLEVEETRSTLVPWELLAFRAPDGTFRFLADSLVLARRPAGARQNRLRTAPVLVAGELSGNEVKLAAPLGEVLTPVTSSFELDSHLFGPEAKPLGVLYLTAHGAARPHEEGGPKVYFPDGSALEPNQLIGSDALKGTLVVMASCHAAEAQQGLLGELGWVSQLKAVGAEAIIAPLWDVDRGRSEVFCEALFSALAAHKSLGVAVAEGRRACRAQGGPDWLAWTLWGDPTLRG